MKHYNMLLTEQETKAILKKRSMMTEGEKKRMQKLAGIITENEDQSTNIVDFLNSHYEEFIEKVANPKSKFEFTPGDKLIAMAGPDEDRGIDVSFDKNHMLDLFGEDDPYNEVESALIGGRKIYYNNYLN